MDRFAGIVQYSGRIFLPILAAAIIIICFVSLFKGIVKSYAMAHLINPANGDRIPLERWETSVGRSKACDVILAYGSVSRFHAVISRRKDGWFITDTFSKTGTRVNEKGSSRRFQLYDGDVISFGNVKMVFSAPLYPSPEPRVFSADPKRPAEEAAQLILKNGEKSFRLTGTVTTIGRDENCSVTLRNPAVSRRHAQITHIDGSFFIEDCGSKAGTKINGEPLTGEYELKDGDIIGTAGEALIFKSAGSDFKNEEGIR